MPTVPLGENTTRTAANGMTKLIIALYYRACDLLLDR
jgi:hypothetical protein